jgi:hypothetical protein
MGCESPPQFLESERRDFQTEIDNLQSLKGIFPPTMNRMTSTTSFRGYPREVTLMNEGVQLPETSIMEMDSNQVTNLEVEDVQTRSKESMNLRCRGSELSNELGNQG